MSKFRHKVTKKKTIRTYFITFLYFYTLEKITVMEPFIILSEFYNSKTDTLILGAEQNLAQFALTKSESSFLKAQVEKKKDQIIIQRYTTKLIFANLKDSKIKNLQEAARVAGSKAVAQMSDNCSELRIIDNLDETLALHAAEGAVLASYKYLKFYKEPGKKASKLKTISLVSKTISVDEVTEQNYLNEAVFFARDIAQSPYAELNALQFAELVSETGKKTGFKVENLTKKQIEALHMGGLLGVNQGSETPPVFSIMTWKHEKAVNANPLIFIGKGVMFDTGGVYNKPYPHMNDMKLDKSGAAAVSGLMMALAKNKIPVYAIALVAATNNAIDAKSYVPGDVLRMHNGLFVEVIHTDAEGRLTLGDALSYADKFKPELVMDIATLTGAAAAAIGTEGCVVMGTAPDEQFNLLEKSGHEVYERTVRFPFWDEYDKSLDSNIADLKNIGGSDAGAIIAGKFLARFTTSPWIHIDIAGPAILKATEAYRTVSGNGFGTRLLYRFVKNYVAGKK